ncbi:response regulator transcription factor [Anabaena sp. UHCC 0399]|uniref:response regulator transcription factor n=1 Tax=Anabaena sp. UHCC 0399 TaxID=3110238 RepID=UPI001686A91F|nr:response regulator transcription factor [Anabaena sp. UHCC 0399]MBD2362878.1 response regulator transcription factor [Anabaena minutissima FACHB-250]MEA5564438.1 response regulator transcription factor [Anabaena sp. UHCC 0399]
MTHILLVEDEVKLARFMELELNYEGYQVSVAYDGLTAIMAARALQLDLIILDETLPGDSGLEFYHRLQSMDNQVPIILLIAKHEVSDRISVLDIIVNDYVIKPFNIEELLTKVNAYLRIKPQSYEC